MASLPPNLNFAATEEEICARWAKEGTFKTQDRLSQERGDEVRLASCAAIHALRRNIECLHVSLLLHFRSLPFTMDLPLLQVR